MLTVPEAAKRANRDPETIRRWIRAGKLSARKVGTQHVISEDDLSGVIGGNLGSVDRPHRHALGEAAAAYDAARIWTAPVAPDRWLTHIVGRIVRAIDPVRIVLFGSRARGDNQPDSDYDLLVILDQVNDRRAARIEIRGLIDDLPIAKDVIVAPVSALDDPDDPPSGALYWALHDGMTIYERP